MQINGNQRCIRVAKGQSDRSNPYAIFNRAALQGALKLPPNTFKLWSYLNANGDGYIFALSSQEFMKFSGMSQNTYNAAWKELINRGYILPVDDIGNGLRGYIFSEVATAAQC